MRAAATVAIGFLLGGCASAGAGPATPPLAAAGGASIKVPAIVRPAQEDAAWWFRAGAASANAHGAGRERATNLILFLGDGMSLPTVAAARILEGQRAGGSGEEHRLAFEEFPYTALSRTYNTDMQTPDSAGTMSAIMTGIKTRMGMISVGPSAQRRDCESGRAGAVATLLELAEVAGLSTGVVSTARLTHATPAATYAHSPERNWESDADLPATASAQGCHDIARQFVEFPFGDGIDVALGGGRRNFLPKEQADPENPDLHGSRLDGRDLVQEWRRRPDDGQYVWNAQQLGALDLANTPRLLGLFESDHMNYEHDRPHDRGGEPSLVEMTRAAITVLHGNRRGYVLMVEGGRIDHGHHAGNAFRALDETIAFSDAVRAARDATADSDTLIVVTADHAHTLVFAGYSTRGNPILGKAVGSIREEHGPDFATDALGLPYTTLSYANGPGYQGASDKQPEGPKRFPHIVANAQPAKGRAQLTSVDTEDPDYLQEATLPANSETHGGDDVGVWASGPGAAAVHGSIEQNEIFHLLLQAQPELRRLLCSLGDCEQGVPVLSPSLEALREGGKAQAR
jgi:alkaline phosphatase